MGISRAAFLLIVFSLFLSACSGQKVDLAEEEIRLVPVNTNAKTVKQEKLMSKALITTSKGAIEIELYGEKTPKTVANFLSKVKTKFYDGLTFHRVEDWVIQGGDPLGTGTGGGKMDTELSDTPFVQGSVGVARGGDVKVSNDAQFFICTTDCAWLTNQYTNFGKVTKGMDVVKKMAIGDKILSVTEQ